MKTIQIFAFFAAIVLTGCGRSGSEATSDDSSTPSGAPLRETALLKEAGTAYVRLKEYATVPMKDATPSVVP